MTIKIDQIADAIISAPGSTIKVLDFIPVSDITTSSLTFVEVDNGSDRAGTYLNAPVSGSYVFSVDLDSITSGAPDTAIYFRLVVDKGTLNEKIVAPDLGCWTQIHTTVSIHRQLSFMSSPVILNSGSHTIVLEWSVSNGSATARMTGAYSYVYINALSSGASGAGGILLDSYSIIAGNATYNSTNWTDVLIQSGGPALQISFDAIINESIGVNVTLDAYNYITGSAPRYADFRLLLDGSEEIAWARQRFNNSISYEELVSLIAYVPFLTKGPHVIKAQVKVENSDMSIAFMNGSSRGKLELIRFRGGLVPIQKDGVTITSVPGALNFKGTNLNIIDTTGVVDVDFYKASSSQDGYLSRSDWSLFNGKVTDVMAARGDLIYRNSSNITDRLQLGANGFILASNGLDAIWKAVPAAHDPVSLSSDAYNGGLRLSGQELSLQIANSTYDGYLSKNDWTLFNGKLTDPMSIRGDLVYRNSSNVTTRLPVGADGYVLTSNGTDVVWAQSSSSGAITTDITYYVDGDNGNDTSNGLSWLTAKKTMAFLYSGDSDAIPREIDANVIVRCRGTILSKTVSRHTVLDSFYGSGSITIEGEVENVVTGLHPTGWDNTTTNVTYHSYIQVNGTAWTIDAYKGMFIQFTSPASDVMYPISNSSASRLETIGLPDLSGTETFKIIQSSAIWRGATVADPITLVEYGGVDGEYSIFTCVECKLFLTLLAVNIARDGYMYSGHRAVIFGQNGGVRINKDVFGEPFWLSRSSLVKSCSIRTLYLIGCVPMVQDSSIGPIIITNDAIINTYENVNFVCVNGCTVVGDLSNWGIQCSNGMATLNISNTRIESCDVGIYIGNGNVIYSPQNILIGSCNKAICCSNVIDFNYGVARFRNNVECINIVDGAKFKYSPEIYSIYGTGNTYDIVITNNPTPIGLSFSQLTTRTVASNFLTGACVSYYDASSMQYVQSRAAVASDIGAEPILVKGNLTEASSDVLTITDGYHSIIGTGTTIQVKKASAVQDGYLSKIDFAAFSSGGHNPVTLNASAVTSGLSLNVQELSARAATTALDGYLKHSDWNTFYNKEPAVTKGNLTETGSSILTFGGVTSGNVIGSGTSIQVKKASAVQDGYLAKGDFTIFSNKENAQTKGSISETASSVLTIIGGSSSTVGPNVTIQAKKASAAQDGYLGKNDFTSFSNSIHNPVTLNTSAVTGGLSLNTQELSFRAATTALDGYLKRADWNTFYNKEPAVTKGNLTEANSSILTFGGNTSNNVIGAGTSIQVKKASAVQDGYLAKGDFTIFNAKENAQTKGSISETASSVLTIIGGSSSTVGPNVTIQAKKASSVQDGYLGKDSFTTFTNSIHNPVTLNASAVTSGLSLNNQELLARAATTAVDGYLKHSDWNTFYGKEVPLTFSNSVHRSTNDVTLTNDAYSPGVNQFYGTSRAGIKGWGTRNIANHFTVGQVGSDCDFTPVLGYGAIYTAVETAIAMGASVSNQYEIIVYPGIYPEPPINVPIGINIKSSDNRIDTAFVVAINPNADLFTMIGGFICGLNVMGVTGATNCLFRCATALTFNVLHGVSFSTCSNGIIVSDGAQLVVTNLSMLIGAPAMNIGVGVTVTGIGSYIGISGGFAAVPSILLPAYYPANPIQTCFHAADNGELFLSAISMRVSYNDSTCDVVFAETNSFVFLSGGEFTGCNNCIHIGSSAVGLGTQVLVQGANFTDNIFDVFNESSIGKVFTNQSADVFNYSGLSGSVLAGIVQVRDENLMRVVGSFRYQYSSGRDVDFADFFADYTSTGVCGGGEVSAASGLFVYISEGDGWVRRGSPFNDSAWVSWDEYFNLPLTANTINYIGYNRISSSLESTTSVPGYGNFILLSTVITGNSSIRFLHKTRNYLTAPMEQLRTYLQSTRKVALDSGLIIETGTSNRKFSISSGSYYLGLDLISFDGYADAYFSYFRGTNGITETIDQYQVNADSYDFGGSLITMLDGYYRSDTILLTSDGKVSVIYGNAEYSTQLAAESSLTRNIPTFIEPSCFPIARVVVEKNSGIKSFVDIRPQPGTNTGSGGGSSGVTSHSALSGLNADDHKQYLLASGSRAMGGDLNIGNNNIVIGLTGLVDGVDVSSHASRHNPGGLDYLATGTPVKVLIGASSSPGSASSYSLSDHQHGLTAVAGVSTDGYLSRNDWAIFYGKEPAQTKGSISETASSVLTIIGGSSSTVGPNVTIQAKKASAAQDGYLGKDSFTTFTNSIHNPVTLNASAVTGGLSLNTQELSFRAATTMVDGYLKHDDWNIFYNKEPAVTKGNLTEANSSVLTFGGVTTSNVIGAGTSIQVKKASAAQDGYLAKGDFTIFNNKENAQSKGSISETASSVLTIIGGSSSTVGPNVTIQAKKASAAQDGYLGKNDFTTFTNSIHNPVTLNASAVTGGLSLNTQELSFRAATTAVDGYLKHADWNTFYNKEPTVTKGNLTEANSSILIFGGNLSNNVIGAGTSIQVQKASAVQDGYLAKGDFTIFSNKEPAQTKGSISETASSVLTIIGGASSTVGPNVTIQAKKASTAQDGYLSKGDWNTFSGKISDSILSNRGDIIYRNASNVTARLGLGSDGYVLTSNGMDLIWGSAADPTRIESGNTYAYVSDTGSDGYFAIVTEGVERVRVAQDGYTGFGVVSPSSAIDVNGNIEVGSINWFYFGGPMTEGTVRMGKSGNDFVIQQFKSNVWVLGTKVIFP